MALTTERLLWLRARRRSMKRSVLKAASAVCISSTCPCIEAAIRAKTTRSIVEATTYASTNDGRTQSLAAADQPWLEAVREWPLEPSSGSLRESREGIGWCGCVRVRGSEHEDAMRTLARLALGCKPADTSLTWPDHGQTIW